MQTEKKFHLVKQQKTQTEQQTNFTSQRLIVNSYGLVCCLFRKKSIIGMSIKSIIGMSINIMHPLKPTV